MHLDGLTVKKPAEQLWHPTLVSLARHNGAVDLSTVAEEGEAVTYRTRLLALEDDGVLLVERPGQPGVSHRLQEGVAVELVAVEQGHRWKGRCEVLGFSDYHLNAATKVRAVRLSGPGEVTSAQRRYFFRVDIAGSQVQPAVLVPMWNIGDEESSAGAVYEPVVGAEPIHANLLNVSGGGVGVRVNVTPQLVAALKKGEIYRCVLMLPTIARPLELTARLVHLRPRKDRTAYLGLQFVLDGSARQRQVQDQIIRFATDMERQQLRRQRGA
jgi:c-di-GMP-binding flagellar brake protein YcgR